ncbi:peptidylprolyl isomerase [Streptomyces sp. NPDC091215]|uniref:peptidylprolyl isomerase n=1 Tax=Streptomyces sp. NPDC091215 TaxID=3155192 RepID=UPI00343333EA
MVQELTATLHTTLGQIVVRLFPESAPETVASFSGLARGTWTWRDPRTGELGFGPLYSGTIFHRVVAGLMIQGGDPQGDGTGGPGWEFPDEIDPSLNFERPYMVAMTTTAPDTVGSQFFITLRPAPQLNGRHTIIGEVIQGQEVVDAVAKIPTGHNGRPITDVVVQFIKIHRQGT